MKKYFMGMLNTQLDTETKEQALINTIELTSKVFEKEISEKQIRKYVDYYNSFRGNKEEHITYNK